MLNKIFGNSRAERTDWSVISSIIRAEARLQSKGEIAPSRRAGIVFRNDDSIGFLHDLDRELDAVLYSGPNSTRTAFEIIDDEQGMRWVVLEDGVFEDLVSSTYTVGNAMGANGADGNLLAAYSICVNNGDSQVLNADLGNGSDNIVVGAAQHNCQHETLAAVELAPPL